MELRDVAVTNLQLQIGDVDVEALRSDFADLDYGFSIFFNNNNMFEQVENQKGAIAALQQ